MTLQDKDVERLVEKYYDGTSTEREELLLKASLDQDGNILHPTLKKQFELMKVLRSEAALGSAFDEDIMKEIRKKSPGKVRLTKMFYSISGVAASLAAILIIWFGTGLFQPKEVYGTVTDPEVAFRETRLAMQSMSEKLNKGLKPAKKTVETIDTNMRKASGIKKMDKALNKMKTLQKVDQASDFLKSINKVYVDLGNS